MTAVAGHRVALVRGGFTLPPDLDVPTYMRLPEGAKVEYQKLLESVGVDWRYVSVSKFRSRDGVTYVHTASYARNADGRHYIDPVSLRAAEEFAVGVVA